MSKFTKCLCVTTALMTLSTSAWAAGFQLKEQSGTLQGLSFAGASAKADDASTIYFNPAGMTRLKGTQSYGVISLIKPSAKFKTESVTPGATGLSVNDPRGGDAGSLAAVPAVYAMTTLDNGVKVGLSMNTPFGLTTEYDDDWVGRYHAVKSSLMTLNLSPSVAWKVNDKLSLGGAISFQYAQAELTNSIYTPLGDGKQKLSGDDLGLGFRLGFLYEPTEKTRIGGAYHSGIHHKLQGNVDVKTPVGNQYIAAEAKLRTPDIASLGIYHEINPQLAVLGEVAWTNWSTFKDLTVSNRHSGATLSSIEENWKDSYFTAVGVEYRPCNCPDKTFQFGVAYDKTPVKDEHRTFRIPDEDRIWLSAGYQQKWGENKAFGVAFTHIMAKDAKVTEDESAATKGIVSGEFDASVNILTANFSMKF